MWGRGGEEVTQEIQQVFGMRQTSEGHNGLLEKMGQAGLVFLSLVSTEIIQHHQFLLGRSTSEDKNFIFSLWDHLRPPHDNHGSAGSVIDWRWLPLWAQGLARQCPEMETRVESGKGPLGANQFLAAYVGFPTWCSHLCYSPELRGGRNQPPTCIKNGENAN